MPIDCELMPFSASPPMYGRSSFVDYHFASSFTTPPPVRKAFSVGLRPRERPVSLPPLRSCLIIRDYDGPVSPNGEDFDDSSPTSPTKTKKKVVFADNKGFPLTHVKVMTEPSDCPPRLKESFFEQVARAPTKSAPKSKWELLFSQPASDYLQFRHKLEKNCVCLENVIIRDTDDTVTGTIKVKNICYNKEVILRTSHNNWSTSKDVTAKYVPSGCEGTSIHDLYDTFAFEFVIPPEADENHCVQFCVCFKTENQEEFWDNNEGKNYTLTYSSKQSKDFEKFEDVLKASFSSWTEFASWNHLVNDTPYW